MTERSAEPAWKTLDKATFSTLMLCIGYAMGAAGRAGHLEFRDGFLALANKLNEGNPNWRPYAEAPDEVIQ